MKTTTKWLWLLGHNCKSFSVGAILVSALLFFPNARVWSGCADDPTFLPEGGGANSTVRAVAIDSTGGVLLGGDFYGMFGFTWPSYFGRVLADGTWQGYVDDGLNGAVYAITVQPDGKILIGGEFTVVYGTSRVRLARLTSAFALDSGFSPPDFPGTVKAIAVQPDGKVIVGGEFTIPDPGSGVAHNITRLSSSGVREMGFAMGSGGIGTDGGVFAIAINTIPNSPNYGKIYIGGAFSHVAGTARPYLARLNANGTLDTTFSPPALDGIVYALAIPVVNNVEKVLIGGTFTADIVNSTGFARLQADGSVDGSFNGNVRVVNGAVKCITVRPGGYTLIGGFFSTASGVSQAGAALYDWNGNIVSGWDTCGGALGSVEAATLQNGNIVIGGTFSAFDGRSVQNYDRVILPD